MRRRPQTDDLRIERDQAVVAIRGLMVQGNADRHEAYYFAGLGERDGSASAIRSAGKFSPTRRQTQARLPLGRHLVDLANASPAGVRPSRACRLFGRAGSAAKPKALPQIASLRPTAMSNVASGGTPPKNLCDPTRRVSIESVDEFVQPVLDDLADVAKSSSARMLEPAVRPVPGLPPA